MCRTSPRDLVSVWVTGRLFMSPSSHIWVSTVNGQVLRTSTRISLRRLNTYHDLGSHDAPWGTHRRRAFTGRGRYKPRIKWHCGPRLAQTQRPNGRFLHLHPFFEFRFRHARRSFCSPSHRWRASRRELRRDLYRPQPTHRRPRFDLCGGVLGRLP